MLDVLPYLSPTPLYIDPGTGFIALQVLMGSLLGAIFIFRTALRSAVRRLRLRIGRKNVNPHD